MTAEEEPLLKKAKTEASMAPPATPMAGEGGGVKRAADGEVTKEKKEKVDQKEEKKEKKEKDGEKREKKEKDGEKKEKKEKDGDKKEKKDGEKKDNKEQDGEKKENKEKKAENGEKKEKKEKDGKEEKKEKKEGKEKDGEKKEKKLKTEKDGKEATVGDKEKKHKKDKDGKEAKVGDKVKTDKTHKDGKEAKVGDKEKKDKKDKDKHKDKKEKKEGKGDAPAKRKFAGKLIKKSVLAMKRKAAPAGGGGGPGPKALMKTEDDYEPVNRWWERSDGAESGKRGAKKWDTFEHHGLMFAPEYEVHGVPLKYDGKEVKLTPEQEELATYWTSVKGTPYETKDIFVNNFWKVFSAALPKDTVITDMSKIDFTAISNWREDERQKRLNRTKQEKEELSAKNKEDADWYSHGLVNSVRERLGNFRLEPPQLFRGRGEHPKQGLLKTRIFPETVCINVAEDACVPFVKNMPGHAWKDVVHENTVQWIASFEDGLLSEAKYVSFAATSGLKGQPDMLKYDRARRLLRCVDRVRQSYLKLQQSKNHVDRQKATATYFIDKLALRVGGEKDTEEEADTVGCCSLRVEHLTLQPPNVITFDFLGKDSIRYLNTVTVTDQVYQNVGDFMKNKKETDQIFDKVSPQDLNEYFKEFMEDLTAKVFRTYNASFTLQQELGKFDDSKKNQYTQDELMSFYNLANKEVAILCNHQKAESKQHGQAMEKMQGVRDTLERNIKILKKHLANLQSGKADTKDNGETKFPKDAVGCKKKIAETRMRLEKHNSAMAIKEENKTVSLGTSKVNYMDPRITVAWCKKVDLAIERVFPRTIRTKFPWAMHFKSDYRFE